MSTQHKYVGLDVHKDTSTITVAESGRMGEIRCYGTISSDLNAVERALAKLRADGATLHVAYEAGPTGFVLYRRLRQLGIDCIVVAPSKTPQPKGGRHKTDRRDAELLARLLRAGELTAIAVPDEVDESIRDLARAKQRLKSFLLRLGYHYTGPGNWSAPHQRYLRALRLSLPAHQAVLEEYLLAFDQGTKRVARLDDRLAAQVPRWVHYPAVQALMNLRGFQLTAATVLVAEIGDIHRFAHPRHLMAFLGLVPREATTGDARRLGSITKAGNVHARWMLIETVQSATKPPKVSAPLALRQEGQPADRRELAWKVQCRLYKRGWHLLNRGVLKTQGHRRAGPRDGWLCLGHAPLGACARRANRGAGRAGPATSLTPHSRTGPPVPVPLFR